MMFLIRVYIHGQPTVLRLVNLWFKEKFFFFFPQFSTAIIISFFTPFYTLFWRSKFDPLSNSLNLYWFYTIFCTSYLQFFVTFFAHSSAGKLVVDWQTKKSLCNFNPPFFKCREVLEARIFTFPPNSSPHWGHSTAVIQILQNSSTLRFFYSKMMKRDYRIFLPIPFNLRPILKSPSRIPFYPVSYHVNPEPKILGFFYPVSYHSYSWFFASLISFYPIVSKVDSPSSL